MDAINSIKSSCEIFVTGCRENSSTKAAFDGAFGGVATITRDSKNGKTT
jgi:hypothetical protein